MEKLKEQICDNENQKKFFDQWSSKTIKQIDKEIKSYQARFERHADTFFHECAPGEVSEGNRVLILKQILKEKMRVQ